MEEIGSEQEFWMALVIYGGIGLAGLLLVSVLAAFGLALKGKLKKKTIIKELYEEKQRKNGQSKGGAHGRY